MMTFDDFDADLQCEDSSDLELFELMEDERAADLDEWAAACEPDWSDLADHLDTLEQIRIAADSSARQAMWSEFWSEIRENGNKFA